MEENSRLLSFRNRGLLESFSGAQSSLNSGASATFAQRHPSARTDHLFRQRCLVAWPTFDSRRWAIPRHALVMRAELPISTVAPLSFQ